MNTVPSPFCGTSLHTVIASQKPRTDWADKPLDVAEQEAFSLVFVFDRSCRRVLLGIKKRGYGPGLIHGFGGKIETGETIKECAHRELREESGIETHGAQLQRKGRLVFTRPSGRPDGRRSVIDIAVFTAEHWQGQPTETEEMSPDWYDVDNMPFERMWPDVRLYFPPLLQLVDSGVDKQLLVRVDYEHVPSPFLVTGLPSLRDVGLDWPCKGGDEADKRDEAVIGYWLAFTTAT